MSRTETFSEVIIHWAGVFMRRSAHDFMQTMKSENLSMTQISTLMHLYYHPDLDVSSIGTFTGVTNAAASQMIERLVQQGLLRRTEDPADRRMKKLALTDKGRKLIEATIEARKRWMEELTGLLSPVQQEDIIQSISLLTKAAEQLEQQQISRQ